MATLCLLGANPLARLGEQFGLSRPMCVCRPYLAPLLRRACTETTAYGTAERAIHLLGGLLYTCSGVYFASDPPREFEIWQQL
jgi:hypothetical protein